ncbi:hypothetical protein BG95_01745 [Thermosipho sp. 1063]|nr:hypothetical protein Y592_01750 [Thermosipho sp. 1070]APT73002.1 hypothetical protein BG95_01745 [Thermosipho sp. 1063]OOC45211.1 hypothetical protein XO08_01735 [Thermosipho sp. 1074]
MYASFNASFNLITSVVSHYKGSVKIQKYAKIKKKEKKFNFFLDIIKKWSKNKKVDYMDYM